MTEMSKLKRMMSKLKSKTPVLTDRGFFLSITPAYRNHIATMSILQAVSSNCAILRTESVRQVLIALIAYRSKHSFLTF